LKATEAHKKYVGDLSSLMDASGKEMSNFVMKIFKTALKSANNSAAFVLSIKQIKPKLQRAMNKKAMTLANKSFELGKGFAGEKKKK
jgi:hypothetical protein